MKISEITKGPGDYWAGDEHNPRSPDYDENAGRSRSRSADAPEHSDYLSDRDREEDRRTRGAAKWGQKQHERTSARFETGEKKGKPHNVVITFVGDTEYEAQRMVESWMNTNYNIYVQGRPVVEYKDATAYMYVQLDPQHFVYQGLQRRSQ